jgi:hypothetical protein
MAASTSRLRLAPDDHSGLIVRQGIKTAPLPWLVTRIDAGPVRQTVCEDFCSRPTLNGYEGADMAESTRGPDPVDRWTRISGVNITPPMHTGPVTTTPSVA